MIVHTIPLDLGKVYFRIEIELKWVLRAILNSVLILNIVQKDNINSSYNLEHYSARSVVHGRVII